MKTTLEMISPVKKKLLVQVTAEEVQSRIEETYKSLARDAKVQGFRPGKVPRNILERYYGSQVKEEVARSLVNETLPKAMEETSTFPLAPPVVENDVIRTGESFSYSALMEVKPEFELKDYLGLDVEKEIVQVSEESVERQLAEIRKANGRLTDPTGEREIRENDYVLVDCDGYEGDRPVEGLKYSNYLMNIGKGEIHPELDRIIMGRKAGDALSVNVHFEEGHRNAQWAGKHVELRVKVIGLKELHLPELNDEFAKTLNADFKDLEDLKKKIREELTSREQRRVEREVRERLLRKISESVKFELPECLVESELDYAVATLRQNLARMGSTLEKAGLRPDKVREDFRPSSERRVKDLLILGEIARLNQLSVDDAEVDESFQKMALSMNQDPTVLRRYYEANHMMDAHTQRLLEEKTLNFLVKGAKIRDVDGARISPEEK